MHRWFTACLALAACGRSAGPSDDEVGQITYWLVTSDTTASTECSDLEQWSRFALKPHELGAGIVYYFIYGVQAGLKEAADYDCLDMQAYDATTCTPSGDMWSITGNALTRTIELGTGTIGAGCTFKAKFFVQLDDEGDQGKAREKVRFTLEGASCAEADADIASASPNGFGLAKCVFSAEANLAFAKSVPKVH